jgi:hypothetical protein
LKALEHEYQFFQSSDGMNFENQVS